MGEEGEGTEGALADGVDLELLSFGVEVENFGEVFGPSFVQSVAELEVLGGSENKRDVFLSPYFRAQTCLCVFVGGFLLLLDVQDLVDGLLGLGESRTSEVEATVEPTHLSPLWAGTGGITCDSREHVQTVDGESDVLKEL